MNLIKKKKSSIVYVAITIIWTWSVLAIPVILRLNFENIVTQITYVLTGASPSVLGLAFILFSKKDRVYKYSFLKRIITIGNANAKDLLIVLTLIPTVTLFSSFVSFVFTSVYPDFSVLRAYSKDFIRLIIFAIFTFVFGPLAEEIGWRGYLMDCWKDMGILVYGVGIGLIWTLWHLPMFFIDGTYQNLLLLQGAIPVICFALSTIAFGIIIGHITKITNSILLAIIFHFTINFTGELIPLTTMGKIINTIVFIVIALSIIYRNLDKRSKCNEIIR